MIDGTGMNIQAAFENLKHESRMSPGWHGHICHILEFPPFDMPVEKHNVAPGRDVST
jgi:NADH:ubiquinone oxidoreductase subunit